MAQLEFLRDLKMLYLGADDVADVTYDCNVDELHGIAVCITDVNDTATATSGADDSGGSERTSAVIGGTLGVVGVLGFAVAFLLKRKHRRVDEDGTEFLAVVVPSGDGVDRTGTQSRPPLEVYQMDPVLQTLQLNPGDI